MAETALPHGTGTSAWGERPVLQKGTSCVIHGTLLPLTAPTTLPTPPQSSNAEACSSNNTSAAVNAA